jgi:hypothetical protein
MAEATLALLVRKQLLSKSMTPRSALVAQPLSFYPVCVGWQAEHRVIAKPEVGPRAAKLVLYSLG